MLVTVKGGGMLMLMLGARNLNTNPNQLLLYKLYFTMSISNWLVFMVSVSPNVSIRRSNRAVALLS